MEHSFQLRSLGIIHTPFKQKLGIPRQPGLAPSAKGKIILHKEFAREDTLRELNTFNYIWLIYWCHQSFSWRETIRPPRLGGKKKIGFLATRSPHRPNPIGLSVVALDYINHEDFSIHVSGIDLLDQTPILDIKPYLPMWDKIDHANNGWIDSTSPMKKYEVKINNQAIEIWDNITQGIQNTIIESLSWDPRPAYTKTEERTFHYNIDKYEIEWKKEPQYIEILLITLLN